MTTKGLAVEAAALRGAKLFLVEGLAVQAMASRGSKLFHVEQFRREAEADFGSAKNVPRPKIVPRGTIVMADTLDF